MIIYEIVGFCVLLLLFYFYKRHQNNREINEPPVFHKCLPIIGHTHRVIGNAKYMVKLLEEVGEQSQKHGGIIRVFLLGHTFYFLTDPEDTLTFASKCLAKSDYYDVMRPWLGDSLILANVDKWKRNRKMLNPAFHQHVLDGFFDALNQQGKKLVHDFDRMVGKGFFDQSDVLKLNTLETISLTVLGIDFQDQTMLIKEYIEASTELFETVMRRIQLLLIYDWVFSLSSLRKRHDKYIEVLNNMTDTVLRKRKLELNKESENPARRFLGNKFKPFMDLLLEMDSMTDQQIRDELNLMMFASHDTTAKTMVFSLHLIGAHPEVQRKLHDELDGISEDVEIDKSKLCELVYLEAVIKETLRLYPVAPVVLRNVDQDVVLKHYTMTKGKYAFLYLSRLNRHPMWGEDAEVFRPERWLEQGGVPDHPAAFASFSIGRRNCIGKQYAMMTMKVALAHVMKNFQVTPESSKLELKLDLMLHPDSGHHIAVTRR